ncbi:MAG: carbamate kinase [Ignavibacteria bacterium]|nr:carbamate kinase [Ignavibacteria bacterium]
MRKLAVVALGGNALVKEGQRGTIDEQEQNVYETCEILLELIKKNYNLIITHGNGPQVGNILMRNEAGYEVYKIEKMPLDICVADSQGGIGYMIERQMRNVLSKAGIHKNIITVVTQVLVDKNDTAFKNPSKPIGPFYIKEEAALLSNANGWEFKEDARKRGWRKVVASPKPIDILNKQAIETMAEHGIIVIAAGGGGIPVYRHENNYLEAIEAVVDKDLASALLAKDIKADEFYIITDVPAVFINYNKPEQKTLKNISLNEAKCYLSEDQFGSGSMEPKIEAAIDFIENGGKVAIITDTTGLYENNSGTRIYKN